MKYQVILFDLDFTIFDESLFLKKVVINSKIFKYPDKIIKYLTYGFRIKSKNIINDILSLEGKITEKNKNQIFQLMKEINIKLFSYDGVLELLQNLRDNKSIKVGLVTNGIPEIQKHKLLSLGISNRFDYKLFTKEIGCEKPNYKPFIHALNQLKVKADKTLFVGDHPLNDIIPANKLGMDTMWIDHLREGNIDSTYRITNPNYLAKKIINL